MRETRDSTPRGRAVAGELSGRAAVSYAACGVFDSHPRYQLGEGAGVGKTHRAHPRRSTPSATHGCIPFQRTPACAPAWSRGPFQWLTWPPLRRVAQPGQRSRPGTGWSKVRVLPRRPTRGSSSGRTRGSDPRKGGSNPSPRARRARSQAAKANACRAFIHRFELYPGRALQFVSFMVAMV
jgi:hypothetical protein